MYIVGKIIKPQGRHGEVKAEIITSFPEHFHSLSTLFINNSDKWVGLKIDNVRISEKFVFLKFAGVDTIDQAGQLRGEYLCIPRENLENLSEDEHYIHDLIGMQVVDENNALLGEIVDVEILPANDIYMVKLLNGNLHAIPAISEVIKLVDTNSNKMTIHVLAGLFD